MPDLSAVRDEIDAIMDELVETRARVAAVGRELFDTRIRIHVFVGAERVLKWAPKGAHDFEKLVTPEEVRAGAPDLLWDEPIGISYQPLGKGWALSSDISMNYMMAGMATVG